MIEYAPGTSAPPPERTTYRVTYLVAGTAGVRSADVTVLPGHSQESDIPGIIAARLTGRPADRRLITLLRLRPL
ncbi:hypothetical protein GCM10018781_19920 [Kitasatospora indigofera]|uniref:Uncharacterized protein n=1 Tax=Kitasatospora indigofera TaxID=67307 RepID=A0A919FID2_9ACTN|nr:hypothetical protein [Kitasatospora indigofera]GHH66270.1 hypothetical protein GCM10018781_19920 [Kitasatospora indigofera]